MKIPDIITDKVNRLPLGYIFTYEDLNVQVDKIDAFTKALSRMVKEGKIRKLSPGKFYKPRITDFGELKPEIYQVVKDCWSRMVKSQVILQVIQFIVNSVFLPSCQVLYRLAPMSKKTHYSWMYKIRFIKQPNKITKENIFMLMYSGCYS